MKQPCLLGGTEGGQNLEKPLPNPLLEGEGIILINGEGG